MSEMGLEIANEMLVAALVDAFPNVVVLQASREKQPREQQEEYQSHV